MDITHRPQIKATLSMAGNKTRPNAAYTFILFMLAIGVMNSGSFQIEYRGHSLLESSFGKLDMKPVITLKFGAKPLFTLRLSATFAKPSGL